MKTIKEILDGLKPAEKAKLQYAFEHGLQQYVELPESRFIGVNCKAIPILSIESEAGVWAEGTVRGTYR